MMKHTIITIGRQFGSGGHEVGNRLAERLDIPLYDHNLIRMAAQELRISSEDATQVDETILGRFLTAYIVSTGNYTAFMSGDESGEPLSDLVFNRQSAIIRKLAEKLREFLSEDVRIISSEIIQTASIRLFMHIRTIVSAES